MNQITGKNPFIFIFLVDQSGSMVETMPTGKSRSEVVADIINHAINSLVVQSKTRAYFGNLHFGLLGYGGRGLTTLGKPAEHCVFNTLPMLEQNISRMERRKKREKEAGGETHEIMVDFPVWLEPLAFGGTPQCLAFFEGIIALRDLISVFPAARAPVVINITDGSATDGDPEELGKMLLSLHTDKGSLSLFNIYLSSSHPQNVCFPVREGDLQSDQGRLFFRISSPLPESLRKELKVPMISYDAKPAGFMYNVNEFGSIAEFIGAATNLNNY